MDEHFFYFTGLWMLRARPSDYPAEGRMGFCPGIFWLGGVMVVLGIHVGLLAPFVASVWRHGFEPSQLRALGLLTLFWVLYSIVALRFRLQGPTPFQIELFHNQQINWAGQIAFLVGIVFWIGALLYGVWRLGLWGAALIGF